MIVASNQNRVILDIALCEELNGDTGLLSIEDFKILSGISSLVPDVKIMTHSGRICLNSNTVDMADCVDNDIASDNDMWHVRNGGKFNPENIFKLDLSVETSEEFKKEQLNDSTLTSVWKKAGNVSDKDFMINSNNGLLYHKDQIAGVEVFQLVIPECKRKMVMTSSHDSNWSLHFGAIKTIQRIKAYFYWSSIIHDVRKFVACCEKCQKCTRVSKLNRVHTKYMPCSNTSLSHVSGESLKSNTFIDHSYRYCGRIDILNDNCNVMKI